ncbi:hypothetical protein FIM02_00220 [SAR202 cluster bacterium AD-802-E10_MRT_200m]|nr:hypothetical protein [SAR202 cluster bacterium AD-802-E10_MRT_200m]
MNLCVVSTFSCTAEDFKSMVNEFDKEFPGIVAEYEIAVVNDHKVVTMLNVIDMDAFSALMGSPKMVEWDAANNNVDVIYSLEQVN